MIVTAGKTNVSVYYYIVGDAGNAAPGEPVTGLLFSDIETGGSASYARQGAARVDLTLITLASASAAHADGGFILVDDTNMPGVYRCDYPDAAFATGVDEVSLSIVVASGKSAVAAPIKVQITDIDFRDSVRAGLTALPNAAADAGGGLPISDLGGLDLDAILADTNELQSDDVPGLIAALNNPALSAIADAVWDEAVAGHVAGGSFGEEVQAHALSSEITALENVSVAQVNAEVVTALAAIRLDELLAADSDIDGAAPPTVGSVFHELLTKSLAGFTYDQATDSLEALRDRGDAAWVTGATAPTAAVIADAVWDEARAAHVAAGSFGEGVVVETNNDKTGYAIGVGGIATTSFAAGAINAAATATDFIDEIWAKICEDQGNYTAQQILSVLLSACAGVTAAATFKTPNAVSDRITATLNASEERTAITLNPSAGA